MDEANAREEIEAKSKEASSEMWNKVMALCSQRILRDVAQDLETKRALGSVALLSELIRIDLKNRADPRQIRNIDLSKRVHSGNALNIDE